MAIDAYNLQAITNELASLLVGGKINKISMPEKDEIIFNVYNKSNYKLLISVNPSVTRLHITSQDKTSPPQAYAFCMLMRKHLLNSTILDIMQVQFERVVKFTLSTKDDLGFSTIEHLIIELTGKTSNILLCDEQFKIIDTLKHFSVEEQTTRLLLANAKYIDLLPPVGKILPQQLDNSLNTKESVQYLSDMLLGVSYQTANEIAFRSASPLQQAVMEFISSVECPQPNVTIDKQGNVLDIYAVDYKSISHDKQFFDSINVACDFFYSQKDSKQRFNEKSKQALTVVKNAISRTEKKLGIQMQSLIDCENYEKNRIIGDLILSNIHMIKPRTDKVSVIDYYDESCPTIEVNLDMNLSPQQNAQAYYKKYNKQKKSIEHNSQLVSDNKLQLEYLNTILLSIKQCTTVADFEEIQQELIRLKLIKTTVSKSKSIKKSDAITPMKFEYNSYTIFAGKNNSQNDYITHKLAKNGDLWLHTKDIHSSHIIVVNHLPSQDIPNDVIQVAAEITAYFSQAKGSTKVPVDYTQKANVKKPSGSPLGFVTYSSQQTCIVDPKSHNELIK